MNFSNTTKKVVILGSSIIMMGSWALTSNVFAAVDETESMALTGETRTGKRHNQSSPGWCEEINNGGLERTLFVEVGGENTSIGKVQVKKRYNYLFVDYDITKSGWCLTGTDVTVVGQDTSIPPKNDSRQGLKCTRTSHHQIDISAFSTTCINGGQAIASIAEYNAPVGTEVTYQISRNGGLTKGYVDSTILPDGLQYIGWCVDVDHKISKNFAYEGCALHSTREDDGLGKIWERNLVDKPENLDVVNYLLNQRAKYEALYPTRGTKLRHDIQAAIWELVDDNGSFADNPHPWGVPDPAIVAQIVADAMANGEGFIPSEGETVGVIVECYDDRWRRVQVTLIEAAWLSGQLGDPSGPSDGFDGPLSCDSPYPPNGYPNKPPKDDDDSSSSSGDDDSSSNGSGDDDSSSNGSGDDDSSSNGSGNDDDDSKSGGKGDCSKDDDNSSKSGGKRDCSKDDDDDDSNSKDDDDDSNSKDDDDDSKSGSKGDDNDDSSSNENSQWRTQTQGGWGTQAHGNNPGTFRDANFANAFPTGLSIGMSGNSTLFTSSGAIECFLPQGGTPGTLAQDSTFSCGDNNTAGVLAGQAVALTLNVTFDAYCNTSDTCTFGNGNGLLKELVVVSGSGTVCDGWTVQQVLSETNAVLAGTSQLSPSAINECVSKINENFVDGQANKGYLTTP